MQNGIEFKSNLSIHSLALVLSEKMLYINWKTCDSEYEGFYVLGRTEKGVKVKITYEDYPNKYFLGVYFYQANPPVDQNQRPKVIEKLQKEIFQALRGMIHKTES
jgi:hypothetical protein